MDPFIVPMLNTLILLSSGATVTLCHYLVLGGNIVLAEICLLGTVILGFYFTIVQFFEYRRVGFAIRDSVYGSVFFVATGFHGLHVIVGAFFLIVIFYRMVDCHFRS